MEMVPKYSIYREGREGEDEGTGGKGLFVTIAQSAMDYSLPKLEEARLGTQDGRNRAGAMRESAEDSLGNLVPFLYYPESPDVIMSKAGETGMPPF